MSASIQKRAADDVAAPETKTLHVVFRVGDAEYVLPSNVVLQMESFTQATPVPGAPPFVAGIVQIRGRVVPVVDLRARFGFPEVEHTLDTRIVVGQHGERIVGLLADAAREVALLGASQISAPPAVVAGENGFVRAIAQLGPRVLMVLDFGKVIGEEPLHGVE